MSDSEDDLISFGTPLEPLEEDEIPNKKPRLLEDQVVTDKQGRRRFHGAFTGGFSAGFFNTVGSLEGWSPSTFRSSKSKKQEILKQKPEDFMDEEDLSEFGIAPVVLKAKEDYATHDNDEFPSLYDFPTLGNYVLQDLLKPVRETLGIKLLRKMGWKPGQGVGPRLNKKEKEYILRLRQKTYGCQLPSRPLEERAGMDQNSDSEWDDLDFAPSDSESVLHEARYDSCGLGYEGLDRRPVLSGNFSKEINGNAGEKDKKFRASSQAFGVGAFEEEDEDIYARDDMSRYDFALGGDFSGEVIKSTEKLSCITEGALDGFVLETRKRSRKHYPLPRLPKDFTPHRKIRHSRFDPASFAGRIKADSKISSEERGQLFKEQRDEVLEGKKQAKELIANIKIKENEFKPFSSNPEKQERYESYLKLLTLGKKELLSHLQPLSMADWDRQREAIEFEKAALLYKPLSGELEDRFSTAKQPDDLCDPIALVEKFVDETDDRMKAARINMFGPLTRKTEDWTPSSLLCKRFNIPEPNKSHVRSLEKKTAKNKFKLFDIIQNRGAETEKIEGSENLKPLEESNEIQPKINELLSQTIEEVPDKGDLFKAIFLASEDEDDEKNREEVVVEEEQRASKQSLQNDLFFEEKLINSKRNLSPPSGIFENIDFELLTGNKLTGQSQNDEEIKCQAETIKTDSFSVDLVYGPKLPEKLDIKFRFCATEPVRDDAVWVEKKSHRKKHKKNKKTCSKSKHKHKKHKR